MKNTKKFLFGFLVAILGLTVQANAEVKPELKRENMKSQIKQIPVNSRARLTGYSNEAIVNGSYVYGTNYTAKYRKINNNEYAWSLQTDVYGSYQTSYYKKINNRWANYKIEAMTKYSDKSSYFETYTYALTSNCPAGSATNGTALNCVVKYGSNPVYVNASILRKNKLSQPTYYYYRTYAANKPSSYSPTYEDWRSYYTNGKTSVRDLTWFNASGKQTKSQEYYYDTRGRLKQRAYYNAKNNRTSLLLYTYYANNRVKAKYTATYNPDIRNRHKAGIYMKYRSNGKKYY